MKDSTVHAIAFLMFFILMLVHVYMDSQLPRGGSTICVLIYILNAVYLIRAGWSWVRTPTPTK